MTAPLLLPTIASPPVKPAETSYPRPIEGDRFEDVFQRQVDRVDQNRPPEAPDESGRERPAKPVDQTSRKEKVSNTKSREDTENEASVKDAKNTNLDQNEQGLIATSIQSVEPTDPIAQAVNQTTLNTLEITGTATVGEIATGTVSLTGNEQIVTINTPPLNGQPDSAQGFLQILNDQSPVPDSLTQQAQATVNPEETQVTSGANPSGTDPFGKGPGFVTKSEQADVDAIAQQLIAGDGSSESAVLKPGTQTGAQTAASPGQTGTSGPQVSHESTKANDQPPPGTATNAEAPPQVTEVSIGKTAVSNPKSIEPDRLAEAHNSEVVQQVSKHIEQMSRIGRNTLRIQLHPEDLGQIDLRITSTSAGVGVSLMAEHNATGKLLEQQLANLRQVLENAGIHLSNLNVNSGNSQSSGSFNQSPNHPTRPSASESGSLVSDPGAEKDPASMKISGRIDYRI
jgi:flagellar hook-length control protein FliK